MRKSLFAKYFAASAVIIIISFTFLITLAVLLVSRYWTSEKIDLLQENANALSVSIMDVSGSPDFSVVLNRTGAAVSNASNTIVFFTDKNGITFVCSDVKNHKSCPHLTKNVSPDIMKKVYAGNFVETGFLSGVYTNKYYTVGVPMVNVDNEIIGAIFISSSADGQTEFVSKIISIFLASGAFALSILFFAIYIMTKRMVKPLAEMSDAAHAMSIGDFSKKIKTDREDEIGQLAKSFNNMTKSLESLELMRSSFVANVSHELKTPMTIIGGFVDGILDGTISQDNNNHYLEIVSNEIKRLSEIVNAMLSLAKLESGQTKMEYLRFNLTDAVCRTIISIGKFIENKHIDIRGMDDCDELFIDADPNLMYQVIYNLVNNAVKFTPENGYIDFKFEQTGNTILLCIENSGDGIRSDEISHVFERFYKADKSRSIDKTGTGLGLYIVKSIVDIHKGEISVESEYGKYTRFNMFLPIRREDTI